MISEQIKKGYKNLGYNVDNLLSVELEVNSDQRIIFFYGLLGYKIKEDELKQIEKGVKLGRLTFDQFEVLDDYTIALPDPESKEKLEEIKAKYQVLPFLGVHTEYNCVLLAGSADKFDEIKNKDKIEINLENTSIIYKQY